MNVLVAPDSFKESMTAKEASEAIRTGWLDARPEDTVWTTPISDGGEGSSEVFLEATNGQWKYVDVRGPLGETVSAKYVLSSNKAFIEIAEAAGLHLVPVNLRDPGSTTSFGVGELIEDALDQGVRHIILGLGGSATNDGGAGIASALGVKFKSKSGKPFVPTGRNLSSIKQIDLEEIHPALNHCTFEVACDVNNPLTGDEGASAVFAKQKGADTEQIKKLDYEMDLYRKQILKDFQIDLNDQPGSGAAGGIGALSIWLLNANLQPGVDILFNLIDLKTYVDKADLIITGEGKIDEQSLRGKAPYAVAKIAKRKGVPVLGIAGYIEADIRRPFDALFSITPGAVTLEDSLTYGKKFTYDTARNIAKVWSITEV